MFDLIFKAVLAAIPSVTCLVGAVAKLWSRNGGPKGAAALNRGPAATVTPCTCTIEKEPL